MLLWWYYNHIKNKSDKSRRIKMAMIEYPAEKLDNIGFVVILTRYRQK